MAASRDVEEIERPCAATPALQIENTARLKLIFSNELDATGSAVISSRLVIRRRSHDTFLLRLILEAKAVAAVVISR
jgi:hypothetical protein